MVCKDTPNHLTGHGPDQNVGAEHQSFRSTQTTCGAFWRSARRISLYSRMSSCSDAPQFSIIASSSFAAARIASNSAFRVRLCAGI